MQRLAALLRERRRRLDHFLSLPLPTQAERQTWEADLYTYDDALVSVADLLDVEVPPGARDDRPPKFGPSSSGGWPQPVSTCGPTQGIWTPGGGDPAPVAGSMEKPRPVVGSVLRWATTQRWVSVTTG